MGMHFKLGLYEHQSAGALQGLINVLQKNQQLLANPNKIKAINVVAYEPAFGIIGDPAKRDPHTRQSADHSMVYILSRKLQKAIKLGQVSTHNDEAWKQLMLAPADYGAEALFDKQTRALMEKITFSHGGKEYDEKYPDGIPTSIVITDTDGKKHESGFVMYPSGHARNTTANLESILSHKFQMLGSLAVKDVNGLLSQLNGLEKKTVAEIKTINNANIVYADKSIDA